MKIKKHIPNFCEGIESSTFEVKTRGELLTLPFVIDFRMDQFSEDNINPYFHRYSYSPYFENTYLLMAEYSTDSKWTIKHWVIGYITLEEGEVIDLPIWEN